MSISYDKVEKAKEKLTVNKLKLGKAGEFLVAGKLLLNGFNIYSQAVDDGIDLVAKKRNKFYYFQVKTGQDVDYDSGIFISNINLDTLARSPENRTFIVFVLHYLGPDRSMDNFGDHNRYEETYIVMPTKDIFSFVGKKNGHVSVKLLLSFLTQTNDGYIAEMKYARKTLILDDYFLNGFWQVEV